MCEYEGMIYAYLDDSLPIGEAEKFEKHLTGCSSCRQKVFDLRVTEQILQKHKRHEPSEKLLRNYNNFLQKTFLEDNPSNTTLIKSPRNIYVLWTKRILAVAAIFLVGFFVGKNFYPTNEHHTGTEQPEELKHMADYFNHSEILLLSITNQDPTSTPSPVDYQLNKKLARKLLAEVPEIQNKAKLLRDKDLIKYLNRLEILLLDVSNSNETEIIENFQEIRQSIIDKQMLDKTQRLQKIFENKS